MRTKYSFIILMPVISFERNWSYGNAALKVRKFFSTKNPYLRLTWFKWQKTYLFSVRFDRLDDHDDSLCLCNLRGKEQLAVKLPDEFSVKNHRASYSWFFRQKLAFGLPREILYSNETLEHWLRGTFAAHNAKEWNVIATETNTATHRFRIRKQNKNASE